MQKIETIGAIELNESFLEWSSDPIQLTDDHGNLIFVNRSWQMEMGLDSRDVLDRPVWEIFKTMPVNTPQAYTKWVSNVFQYRNSQIALDNNMTSKVFKILIFSIESENLNGHLLWLLKSEAMDTQKGMEAFKAYEKELENEKLEDIIDSTNAGTWEWDIQKNELIFNEKWADILGYDLEEISPISVERWEKFIHPEDLQLVNQALDSVFSNKVAFYNIETRIKHREGHWIWVLDRGKVIKWSESGKPLLMFGSHIDITETVVMRENLHVEKELFKTTLLSVGDGVIATDPHGRIIIMNQVAEYLTGWRLKEVMGKPFDQIFNVIHEHSLEPCEDVASTVLQTGDTVELSDILLISKDGRRIPIEKTASPIKDLNMDITGVVVVFRDFTEKKEKQKEVEYLSFHDHLTGLYNRRYMEDALSRMDTQRNLPFAIMVLDVNGLKLTNDAFGHEMGDALLKTVSEIIKNSCRADDVICRTGGDEFAILLPNTNEKTAFEIRERILTSAKESTLESVIVSMAVGFDIKDEMETPIRDVLKRADNYMYQDKMQHGKSMRNDTIETVLRNVNQKYSKEKIHTERVSQYAERISMALGCSKKDIEDAKIAGILHDIGKIMVPAEVLNKTSPLTDEEKEEIRRHPVTSYHILKAVDEYASFASAVLYHHERMDGKGYPKGLRGEDIPLLARILCVADAYEAMTSDRPYREKISKEEAIEELRSCSGTQFDPEVVEVFVNQVLNN